MKRILVLCKRSAQYRSPSMLLSNLYLSSLRADSLFISCCSVFGSKHGCRENGKINRIKPRTSHSCKLPLTVSQIFMLQQFSIVISHCSGAAGRHVSGVRLLRSILLRTTNVFLIFGRIGL